jgi:hypothetical protein
MSFLFPDYTSKYGESKRIFIATCLMTEVPQSPSPKNASVGGENQFVISLCFPVTILLYS